MNMFSTVRASRSAHTCTPSMNSPPRFDCARHASEAGRSLRSLYLPWRAVPGQSRCSFGSAKSHLCLPDARNLLKLHVSMHMILSNSLRPYSQGSRSFHRNDGEWIVELFNDIYLSSTAVPRTYGKGIKEAIRRILEGSPKDARRMRFGTSMFACHRWGCPEYPCLN